MQLLSLYAVEFNTAHKIDQIVAMTKISLSQERGSISWYAIYGDDAENQVKILDSTITKVYDKHCPVRNARVPVGMNLHYSASDYKAIKGKARSTQAKQSSMEIPC